MLPAVFEELCRVQHGVISRAQALACGLTVKVIESKLRSRRWQRLYPGVFATFTGSLGRQSRLWAALLRAGDGATLSHETAAEVAGLTDPPAVDAPIHITVPDRRRVTRIRGVVLHRSSRVDIARHPSQLPPRTRIEETVVDLTQTTRTLGQALSWLTRAVGARLTTAARLRKTIADRSKVRWRRYLNEALLDVETGCHSMLELRYYRTVERAHGLPRGTRQAPVINGTRRTYDDVHYKEYRTVVELDGRAAHPDSDRWRDMRRDNASVEAGRSVLRYGMADVYDYPCHVALQATHVLTANGWTGSPMRCPRPNCVIPEDSTPDEGSHPP
jgi:hypothetical protein